MKQLSKIVGASVVTEAVFTAMTFMLIVAPVRLRAATAPPATLIYNASGPVKGGVATIGSSGETYFTALSANGNSSKVVGITVNGAEKWTPFSVPNDIHAVPALDSAGAKLYVGSDGGIFYCLATATGNPPAGWNHFTVPGTGDRKIRSGAAIDPNNSTVYFHCNDGFLYALDANTGGQRWRMPTGNNGGPPAAGSLHDQPVSSSPVVDASGNVYVASANGHVFRFNPSNGAQLMDINVNNGIAIEASLAIGNNGLLYGATRSSASGNDEIAFGINPVTATVVWQRPITQTTDGAVGVIVAPVIDQLGFVYVADFGHALVQLDGTTGSVTRDWSGNTLVEGKLCQTPTLLQNGLLLLGESFTGPNQNNSQLAAFKISGDSGASPIWTSTGTTGAPMGPSLFGAVAVRCTVQNYIFIADTSGHVYRLTGTDPVMSGQWPTLQCGNRRAGKSITYPTAIAELPSFTSGNSSFTLVNRVDVFGRAVGQAYGYYDFNCGGSDFGYAAALWRNNSIATPSGCIGGALSANTFATALNGIGDVCGYTTGTTHPIAWHDGANIENYYTTLSTPNFTTGSASDINPDSTTIGNGSSGSDVHVFRWEKSGNSWPTPVDLNGLSPAGVQTYGYAIADDGSIAGKTRASSTAQFHAFKIFGRPNDLSSETIDMGTMGGTASEAWDTHETKGTVGRSQLSTGFWRAFLLPISAPNLANSANYEICFLPGVTRPDRSSAAYGINKFAQVVGYAQDQNLANRAVLYSDQTGVTIDINTITLEGGQTPASLGWTLTQAQAINDNGVIVGYGSVSGRNTAWILYPKCQD